MFTIYRRKDKEMDADQIKIIEAFAKLLDEKPFDSISAKDVTDAASLPPTRLFYWFHDLYEVADALFDEESRIVTSSGISPEDGGEAFLLSVSYVLRYPEAAKNICLSSAGGIYKKHVMLLAGKYFSEVIVKRCEGAEAGERERDAVRFLRAAAVSLASRELIRDGDPRSAAERFTEFFDTVTNAI